MPLNTGQLINNRYRIVKLLGQGGFGAVYRAWDVHLNKVIALKENLDTTQPAQIQFTHEATILANLSHPNLPRVTDHFILPGQGQYLVMDYVAGDDLEKMLHTAASGILPEKQVLIWMLQVLDALSYLHSLQPAIIHRDLKPANIKILPEGTAVLVDFGIAKIFDAKLKTTVGARAVTPGYSPPEQYGHGKTDARSDLYALGAVMYNVLTGQEPPESVQRTIGVDLISPRDFNPAITIATEQVILRAMELQPDQRYQHASEFIAALQAPASSSSVMGEYPPVNAPAVYPARYPAVPPATQVGSASVVVPANPTFATSVPPPVVMPVVFPSSIPAYPLVSKSPRSRRWRLILGFLGLLMLGGFIYVNFMQNSINPPTNPPTHLAGLQSSSTPIQAWSPTKSINSPGNPTQAIGATLVSAMDGMVMVRIPAGDFLMGATDADTHAESSEKPQHQVYMDAFWMYQTEVTNAMYTKCVQANACPLPDFSKSETRPHYFDVPQFGNYPVVYVSWIDANDYCQWAGGRLPTEAEWEKAARGGLEAKLFPWGDELPVCTSQAQNGANFPACSLDDTRQVMYFSANGYGLYDMAGNVAEWVNDWFGDTYYTMNPENKWPSNPSGPLSGEIRVLRSGSWNASAYNLRVSYRYGSPPTQSDYYIGFRCAR